MFYRHLTGRMWRIFGTLRKKTGGAGDSDGEKKEEKITKGNILLGQIWVEEIKNKILKIVKYSLRKKKKKE